MGEDLTSKINLSSPSSGCDCCSFLGCVSVVVVLSLFIVAPINCGVCFVMQ